MILFKATCTVIVGLFFSTCSLSEPALPYAIGISDIDKRIEALNKNVEYHCSDVKRLALCNKVLESSVSTINLLESASPITPDVQLRLIRLKSIRDKLLQNKP